MFGYLRTRTSELRLRDYECYRAYYCGLCRAMGACTGQCSRLSLSYDFVFLAAVRCSLLGESSEVKPFRCLIHPAKKRKAVKLSPQLAYCADASAILTAGKLSDDRADERGFRKLRATVGGWFFSGAHRSARKRHPGLDRAVREKLALLREYERHGEEHSADELAAVFGDLLAAVFSDGLENADARIAAAMGKAVGYWIYLADAADDFEEDRKKKRFNALRARFGDAMTEDDRASVRLALGSALSDAQCAFELIDKFPHPELKEILSNILYIGMPDTAKKVTAAPEESKGDRK